MSTIEKTSRQDEMFALIEQWKQSNQTKKLFCQQKGIAPVLTKDKPESTHKGYHWVYYSPLDKLVCFDYRKGRGREGPAVFLEGYRGILQSDGYSAYDAFEKLGETVLLACMAHARRNFEEALKNDPGRAGYVLTQIQELYDVERHARELNLNFEERKALRIEKSLPVLKELKKWLKRKVIEVLPKSAMGIAVSYTLGLWNRLIRYIDDGNYCYCNGLFTKQI